VVEVPHSAGTARAATAAPDGACDAHIHVYDARFPAAPGQAMLPRAGVAEYRLLQRRTGTSRVVVVQPRAAGTGNAVTVDALAQFGLASARGVAVVHPAASDAELKALDAAGIRGLRFSVHEPQHAATTVDMVEPLARRIAGLGWHVQLHMTADQLVAHAALLGRLACPIVIDHRARLPAGAGPEHPAFALVRRLLDAGRTWVKISGPYLDSRTGGPAWADVAGGARALIAAAPGRMLWGSDWPHPTEKDAKPDDAALFDRLADWAPDEATRRRILVDNPCELYGFEAPCRPPTPAHTPEETS
jgi:predicted TIM-barrel fold metal-dependent hydrolase